MTNHHMQGRSGHLFHPGALTPEQVNIRDVAASLSKICRFGGHCIEFLSVAEHSLVVSKLCYLHTGSYDIALQGLLHDAQEAYTGDFPTPLKRHFPALKDIQDRAWEACAKAFNQPLVLHPIVKRCDLECLTLEVEQNMATPDKDVNWSKLVTPTYPLALQFLGPKKAEENFLRRYRCLLRRLEYV